jgi:RNA polymerase sigma-70 factor (ECF subfamily)
MPASEESSAPSAQFPTTHWSLISRLHSPSLAERSRALDELCLQYHYPLYCYIRRRGLDHHDAQDALHDFLGRLLRLGSFGSADAEKGRLRAYLLTALQRFLINWQRGQRHRRHELSVDTEPLLMHAEDRYRGEQFPDSENPAQSYDRKWATELMQAVLKRLEKTYESRNRSELFQALRPVLLSGGSLQQEGSEKLADRLGMKPGAVRVALLRMLRDYRKLLQEEILLTVQNPREVKEEFQELMRLFSR